MKGKEPKIEQPSVEAQRNYASIRDNDATVVSILGTKKKYKIRWLKNGQIEKLSRLLIRKGDTDNEDGTNDSPLDAILDDSKLACKAAAIYILDGYWKLRFRYWYLWRWFYYVRQYDNVQLQGILDEGKKKVPLTQFLLIIVFIDVCWWLSMRYKSNKIQLGCIGVQNGVLTLFMKQKERYTRFFGITHSYEDILMSVRFLQFSASDCIQNFLLVEHK